MTMARLLELQERLLCNGEALRLPVEPEKLRRLRGANRSDTRSSIACTAKTRAESLASPSPLAPSVDAKICFERSASTSFTDSAS